MESRIKPHDQQLAESSRRVEQRASFRRRQIYGLLMAAAAVVIWTVLHTKPGWIFPAGWWRFP